MGLFQRSVLKNYIASLDEVAVRSAYKRFETHFLHPEKQKNIRASKEEQYQEGFLRELFVDVLGYTINPTVGFNLVTEQQNTTDQKKADAAILIDGVIKGVVELKGTNTFDLNRVQDQAFRYYNNHKDAVYVVTSNFEKLRFYIQKTNEFEEFNLFTLTYDEFILLYLCLSYDNLSKGLPLRIKNESVVKEQDITKSLYKDYSKFKQELFHDLCEQNKSIDKLVLFKATQKLIDRFLFIFFCEDNNGLLPANSIAEIIKHWNNLREMDEYRSLYEIFRKYFEYINTGRPAAGNRQEIFAYNGGLFSEDSLLDNLRISDTVLYTHAQKLSGYDFVSEVDVNILGHIFEHSLNDLEELQAELEGTPLDKAKTKRKKDGVFYTPRYITEYIVENTIGKLCVDKKESLGIVEDEYVLATSKKERTTLNQKLIGYKEYLLSITICDPACGSGAFLNQAFIFLQKEHQYIADLESKLFDTPLALTDVSADILENNLYGVDINEESVEIARLSLWLRSAKKGRKLNNLSSNIKCGNSLIDDPEVAGDKAFSWEKEFPNVFERGGFDVVIGNPPYGAKISRNEVLYCVNKFSNGGLNKNFSDTYISFYIISLQKLLKFAGILGFIAPNTWRLVENGLKFRKFITSEQFYLYKVIQHTEKVFSDATVDVDTVIIQRKKLNANTIICVGNINNNIKINLVSQNILNLQKFINLNLTLEDYNLKQKLEKKSSFVGDLLQVKNGVKPYEIGKGKPPQTKETLTLKPFTSEYRVDDTFVPLIGGSSFNKYKLLWDNDYWIKYGEWLAAPRDIAIFKAEHKLIFRQTSDKIIGTYIEAGYVMRNNTHILLNKEKVEDKIDLYYCLGLLNSKLLNYYYQLINPEKGEALAEVKAFHLENLPIIRGSIGLELKIIHNVKTILDLNSESIKMTKKFVSRMKDNLSLQNISKSLLSFYKMDYKAFLAELKKQKVTLSLREQDEWEDYFNEYKSEINKLQSELEALEKEIDQKVYELYGLSDEEIKIVENG